MDKDNLIKEAFSKVKEQISSLDGDISLAKLEILSLKQDIKTLASSFNQLLTALNQYIQQTNQQTDRQTSLLLTQAELLSNISKQSLDNFNILTEKIKDLHGLINKYPTQNPTDFPTPAIEKPTNRSIIPTQNINLADIPTDNQPFYSLINSYKIISIGNEGVPTNKPTDKQTNQQTENISIKTNQKSIQNPEKPTPIKTPENQDKISIQSKLNNLEKASEILSSLDSLKKEVRLKFKRLTNQEFLIFSTIYQLEEEGNIIDYPLIAEALALSESSCREYVQKIISKGIPIKKEKLNNKKILLSISPDLKKIASLETIMQLRDL